MASRRRARDVSPPSEHRASTVEEWHEDSRAPQVLSTSGSRTTVVGVVAAARAAAAATRGRARGAQLASAPV